MTPLYSHGARPASGAAVQAVIPPGWDEHHRPVAESSLTSDGTIYRVGGAPPYPKPEGWTGRTPIYSGVFRVQQQNREGGGTPGEQPTQERTYMVVAKTDIPHLQTGERGDIIVVAGRELRVRQVLFGSHLWEMDILCTDNLTQQNPV